MPVLAFEEELNQHIHSWMAGWLPQQLGGYRCRNLTAALPRHYPTHLPRLPTHGVIPVSIQCLLRLPNGDESWRCVRDLTMPRRKGGKQVRRRRSRTNSFNGISTLQIVGESVVWRALKSHCSCLHCAQRPAVADSFISTQLADYQRAGETQILSVDTLKSPCRGLCWCPVHQLSCLKITFKETDIKLSYLVPAHTCQDRSNLVLSSMLGHVWFWTPEAGKSCSPQLLSARTWAFF